MNTRNVVACMRWGEVFPPDYVNVLYNAMRQNLTEPFDFVCLTTDPAGLHPDITVMEIPAMGLPESAWKRGAWPKVSLLKPGLFGDGSKVLFVDLDSMVVGSMDEFLEFSSGFHAIGSSTWSKKPAAKPKLLLLAKKLRKYLKAKRSAEPDAVDVGPRLDRHGRAIAPNTMGTGIFGFIAGAHGNIYDELVSDIPHALKSFTNEQHFIEHHLDGWSPWRAGAVSSFKYDLRRPVLLDFILAPRSPQASSPLLAFHGHPRPMDLVTRRMSRKEELPHVWFGPVRWFADYWHKHNHLK